MADLVSCAVLDDYQGVALQSADWSPLMDRLQITVHRAHFDTEDALAHALADASIVVAMRERTPFTASLFEKLPRLKLLVTTGRQNAAIDLQAAQRCGVTVSGTGTFATGTAELTWALILGWMRRIPQEWNNLRTNGPWQTTVGMDLAGKRLGVLGLGHIGSQVAAIGKAFGMHVQAWSAHLTQERCAHAAIKHAGSLDALLTSSDVISVHLGLGERTRGLLGATQLRRMKSTALLVNTSRAPIVDETALVVALRERWIGGAAIDVFEREPLTAAHPFRGLDNLLATPHLGYVTEGTYRVYFTDVVADIEAWLGGAPLRLLTTAR